MFRLACAGAILAAVMGAGVQGAREQDRGTASRGKEIFEQCSGCHSAENK